MLAGACGRRALLLLICVSFLLDRAAAQHYDWSLAETALLTGIQAHAFPGCAAIVATENEVLLSRTYGNFTYGLSPPFDHGTNPRVRSDSRFDLASCTKVVGATSAIAQFYQRGELDLHTRIADIIGADYGQNGKQNITVLNCLLHNAGYPPDPDPNYWNLTFGCPETSFEQPEENFSCQTQIYNSLLAQTLENPIGEVYVYSDLSFITLMYVVGALAREHKYVLPQDVIQSCIQYGKNNGPETNQCYFEAYVRNYVFKPLKMDYTGFLPPQDVWQYCVPAENTTVYQNKSIQGQVSDGNAYALGGIAGHAGLFSTADDLLILARRVLFAPEKDDVFINKTTAQFFTTEYNHSQSSRALGWNTNDPTVFDQGWDLCCGTLAPTTFMHIGYTGTQICADPVRKLITILLTNRVYPIDDVYSSNAIYNVRKSFNTAVQRAYDRE